MAPRLEGQCFPRRLMTLLLMSLAIVGLANGSIITSGDWSADMITKAEDEEGPSTMRRSGRKLLTTTPEIQKAALLALKASLVDPNGYLATWNPALEPCGNWVPAITCEGGPVYKLKLTDPGLKGTIPPNVLGSFTSMTYLSITNNGISGFLGGSGIETLPSLNTVYVYGNRMSGFLPASFTTGLGLNTINIHATKISGVIPPEWTSYTGLGYLDLSANRLWGPVPLNFNNVAFSALYLNVADNPGLCGSMVDLVGAFNGTNTSVGVGCPAAILQCINTQQGNDLDYGCWSGRPICYNHTNPALSIHQDMSWGHWCTACIDTQPKAGQDFGCSADQPICYEDRFPFTGNLDNRHGPSDGDYEEGAACVACIDSMPGAGLDDGCAGQKDYFFGKDDAHICYDGGASDGDWAEGEATFGLPIPFTEVMKTAPHLCTVCIDDQAEIGPDTGCLHPTKPFCLDWSPLDNAVDVAHVGDDRKLLQVAIGITDSPFLNNADFGFGIMCTECVDSRLGLVADTGCTDPYKPFCLPVSVYGKDGQRPFDGSGDAGHCVGCVDDEEAAWGQDFGCTEVSPKCIQSHTTVSIFEELVSKGSGGTFHGYDVPITSRGHCAGCRDTFDNNTLDADEQCPPDYPFCVYADESDKFGLYCSKYPNPICYFEVDDVEESVDATCPTNYALVGTILVEAENCTMTTLNLRHLAYSMTSVLQLPNCSIGLTMLPPRSPPEVLPNTLPDIVDHKRHLLQVDRYVIGLQLRIFVENLPNGTALLEVFRSLEMAALLAFFEENFGDIISISITDTMVTELSAVTSDPHFVTPGGFKFDFNGLADQTYCIVTDDLLQMNARFMGAAADSRLAKDARTWMDQVAILYGNDKVLVEAASPPGTSYASSFGTILVNGELLPGRFAFKKSPSGLTVARKKSRVVVTIPGVAVLELETVRAAFWEAGAGPGRNFLNLHVKQFNATNAVHGVLGQAFAAGFNDYIEGVDADYLTSGIFNADCHFNHFQAA